MSHEVAAGEGGRARDATRLARPVGAGLAYRILRGYFRLALGVFYRRIEVEGEEQVPERGPLLLVANHTNALLDPLVIGTRLERPIALTAATSMARNPLLAALMRATGAVQLRRADEGTAGVPARHNLDALAALRALLADGQAICLFPEGRSHNDVAMRPFQRGAARLALDHHAAGDPGGLRIVPVGLIFEAKSAFRSRVLVRFGAPLAVARWVAANPQGRPRDLTAELQARVAELTHEFAHPREAEGALWAAEILETAGDPPPPLDHAERPLAQRSRWVRRLLAVYRELRDGGDPALAAATDHLEHRIEAFRDRLAALGISPAEVFLPVNPARGAFFVLRELELVVLGLPMAVWGTLNHLAPTWLARRLAARMADDRDAFVSNVVFLGLVVFPLCYLLQIGLVAAFAPLPGALLYAASLPLTGTYAVLYATRVGGVVQRIRTFLRFAREPDLQAELAREARGILEEMHRLADALAPPAPSEGAAATA